MEPTEQLSLSWDAHQKSICSGLSLLQQRGEFVDMTLAADGHHVKVHKMVMSLVSPYIKALISSAQCPHPVIFLNNISYTTLCAILEYIYTGEVHVTKNKLSDLIAAGKALHIRGLREMDGQPTTAEFVCGKNITETLTKLKKKKIAEKRKNMAPICKVYLDENNDINEDSIMDIRDESMDVPKKTSHSNCNETFNNSNIENSDDYRKIVLNPELQYTVSNQGGLQVIYNRYVYHHRYTGKKDRKKMWRCIDYNNLKCSANIFTDENNQVTHRSYTHNHPFHDSIIMKKFRLGSIYSGLTEAENTADGRKKKRRINIEKDREPSETSD